MPVLKIKTENGWEELGSTSTSAGGNADTLDGKHADEFATVSDVDLLKDLVGDIETALDSIIAIQESLIGGDSA